MALQLFILVWSHFESTWFVFFFTYNGMLFSLTMLEPWIYLLSGWWWVLSVYIVYIENLLLKCFFSKTCWWVVIQSQLFLHSRGGMNLLSWICLRYGLEPRSYFVEVWKIKKTTYNIVQVLIAATKVLKLVAALLSFWFLQGMIF